MSLDYYAEYYQEEEYDDEAETRRLSPKEYKARLDSYEDDYQDEDDELPF